MLSLFKERIFLPLFLTQFFGAFNDNAFKLAMLTLISYHLSASQVQSEQYQAIASALFMLPFFLLSATAGQLADRYDKATLVRWIKLFEISLVTFGGFAFYFGNPFLLMATLTGMGIHSTFFGPIKYAILPQQIPKKELLGATSLIEGSTFIAILLGTIFGTLSIGGIGVHSLQAITLMEIVSLAGLLSSLFILPARGTSFDRIDWNIWRATSQVLQKVTKDTRILVTTLAISWFWLIGAVMLTKLPDYTNYVLRANPDVFAVFLALFSIGIALGSITISRLLAGKITLKYVPHAMILLSLFAFDLYWASPASTSNLPLFSLTVFFKQINHWRIAADLFLLAFSGGVFVVPLYTYLQVASDDKSRARVIAANNIINSFFMVLGTCLVMLLLSLHAVIPHVFLVLAILNGGAAFLFWRGLGVFNMQNNAIS